MSLPSNQWDHIGLLSQRPTADNFSEGYTYLASDATVGFVVSAKKSGGPRFWQQIFCQCWTVNTPTCSVKNISNTSQTLPAAYGGVTLPPNQSIILPDDAEWTAFTLRTNGISTSNFAIGALFQDCPLDAAVYVDGTNGNDANPGTQALPVATIRQGFRLWPKNYVRTCNMFVSGTTQESAEDMVVYPPLPVGADAQPPCIIGAVADVGLGTLTVQSFSPNIVPSWISGGDSVIPTTSLPIGFDAYVGMEYYCVDGPLAGRVYTIMNNDTGAFYLPHSSHNFQPTVGQHFQIRKPVSTITLSGKLDIRKNELAMYGFIVNQAGANGTIVLTGSILYPDSVQFNTYIIIMANGLLAPGHAHNLCKFPGSPAVSIGTVGTFVNNHILAYNGKVGDFRYITGIGDGSVAPTGLYNCVLIMRNGQLFVEDGSVNLYVADLRQVRLFGSTYFSVIEHWRLYGSPGDGINATGPVHMDVEQVDISGCAGNGITLDLGAVLYGGFSGGNVAGHTNGGVGVHVSHGVKANIINTTLTGLGGDVIVGSNTVDTWTNIATNNAAHTTDFNASSTGVATSQGCRVGP